MTLFTYRETMLGNVLLTSRAGKLSGLYFVDQPRTFNLARDWRREDEADIFEATEEQLRDFAGRKRTAFDLPLGLEGTPFQIRVWAEIGRIPFGGTVSYGELAGRMGIPGAARAVGAAAGRNPVCWVVGCHRVVGKGGQLTGYAGGLGRKRELLEFEAELAAVV